MRVGEWEGRGDGGAFPFVTSFCSPKDADGELLSWAPRGKIAVIARCAIPSAR